MSEKKPQPATPTRTSMPTITGPLNTNGPKLIIVPKWLDPYKQGVAAYSSSLISVLVGFPLDSMKTRIQTYHYATYRACISDTITNEGIKGFFRGVWAPLLSTSVSRSVSLSIYISMKPIMTKLASNFYNTDVTYDGKQLSTSAIIKNLPISMGAGLASGACVTIFACPFEFTKLYSQVEQLVFRHTVTQPGAKFKPNNTFSVAKRIVQSQGFGGLYSGFRWHLLRDSLGTGVYFCCYETLKLSIAKIFSPQKEIGSATVALAGALAGALNWVFIFPIDTTKSLIQRDVVALIQQQRSGKEVTALPKRMLQLGDRNSYRGLGISITRTALISMIFFTCYEKLCEVI